MQVRGLDGARIHFPVRPILCHRRDRYRQQLRHSKEAAFIERYRQTISG